MLVHNWYLDQNELLLFGLQNEAEKMFKQDSCIIYQHFF